MTKKAGALRLRISVSPRRGVTVTLPRIMPWSAGISFLMSKRQWVEEALRRQELRQRMAVQDGKTASVPDDPAELERMRERARAILVPKLRSAASQYGFSYGRIAIKNNVSNWGSCSTRGISTSTCASSSFRSTCRTMSYCMSSAACATPTTGRSSTPCSTPCSAGKRRF